MSDSTVDSRAELEARLKQSEAEILRLRDLLIGKEAELGVAVGRVAELEHRRDLLTILKHRWQQARATVASIPGVRQLKRRITQR